MRTTTSPGLTAALVREDFRASGRLKCKPPNRACGGRCIPPSWDCRLKGEGNDPHLQAAGKGSDPVAGFANIERGLGRLRKAAVKLSFSELEGGRRAIARGAAKLSPADLKKKKELQDKINQHFVTFGAPIAGVLLLGLGHRGLKVFRGYREGPGAQVDNAISETFRFFRRNDPIGGGAYRAREAAGPGAVNSMLSTQRSMLAGSPATLRRRASTGSALTENARLTRTGYSEGGGLEQINRSLLNVDRAPNSNGRKPNRDLSYSEWEARSAEAFWSTRALADTHNPAWLKGRDRPSLFSQPTANTLLSRSLGVQLTSTSIKSQSIEVTQALQKRLSDVGKDISESMRLAGLDPANTVAVDRYVRSVRLEQRLPSDVSDVFYKRLVTATTSKDHLAQAHNLYSDMVQKFDNFYADVATRINDAPGIRRLADDPELRFTSVYRDGMQAWTETLADKLNLPDQGMPNVLGPGTATVIKKAYYSRFVQHLNAKPYRTNLILTPTEAATAATEIARARQIEPPKTATDALQLLNEFYAGGSRESNPNRLGSISLVQTASRRASRPQGTAPQTASSTPTATEPRPNRRRSRAQRLADIRRERNPDGTPRYATPEAAEAELRRREGRADALLAERFDFTPQDKRLGKPCGKSFTKKQNKCSKPTSRGYAKPPQGYRGGFIPRARKKPHEVGEDTVKKIGAVALGAAALAVGGRAAYRNRARIAGAIPKGARKQLKRTGLKSVARVNRARKTGVKKLKKAHLDTTVKAIKALSSDEVKQGLTKVPEQYRESATKLVGKAKTGLAHQLMHARGSKLIKVDNKNNHSTFRQTNGDVVSVGSVGDSLVMFRTHPEANGVDFGEGQNVARYTMDFTVDLDHARTNPGDKQQGAGIIRSVKSMFNEQVAYVPEESFVTVEAYSKDALGDKRTAIYRRFGFTSIGEQYSSHLWAMKYNGKIKKLNKRQATSIASALRSRKDALAAYRADKRCGKSGIPDNRKCSKPTAAVSPERGAASTLAASAKALASRREVQVAAGATAIGAALLLGKGTQHQRKIERYRKNVAKSAIEAEKLAIEYERQFRDQAAQRLKKRPQDVTGFEASTYNFKDKGYDRGFGGFDNDPKYYGQTPNSRGAVVMLSYADDGRHTRRGQGSFKMVEGGAFKNIWGEHDVLPYANNISQPSSSTPDDLDNMRFNKIAEAAENIAGKTGRQVVETARTVGQVKDRFKYLRDNIDTRGFNPDAVRVAAFVAAQRRLTGKPVHIMSYSNGGSVATEALAILNDMGYRDVKVVNIAGPTFGIFQHKPENMQTWVSEGDEFWKMTAGRAYVGSKVNKLQNKNIMHGLKDGIDPNDTRFTKEQVKANIKAKNSYLLDEQLRKEAYTFLTVDKNRSQELVDEIVWRTTTNKPFEGDLGALYGDTAVDTARRYKSMLERVDGTAKAAVRENIRAEVEERMIETWYGGYKPTQVKRRAEVLAADVQRQATRPPRSSVRPTRKPRSLNDLIAAIKRNNPDISDAAARAEAERRIKRRKDSWSLPIPTLT